jgi:hypothetical protein
MITIGILTTWLTLTAAGFAGLSALGRIGAREGIDADATLMEHEPLVLADARIPIPTALAR